MTCHGITWSGGGSIHWDTDGNPRCSFKPLSKKELPMFAVILCGALVILMALVLIGLIFDL